MQTARQEEAHEALCRPAELSTPPRSFSRGKIIQREKEVGEKTNPRATADAHSANTALLEQVVNLLPDACHHCCLGVITPSDLSGDLLTGGDPLGSLLWFFLWPK